jgi:hypothetical protein
MKNTKPVGETDWSQLLADLIAPETLKLLTTAEQDYVIEKGSELQFTHILSSYHQGNLKSLHSKVVGRSPLRLPDGVVQKINQLAPTNKGVNALAFILQDLDNLTTRELEFLKETWPKILEDIFMTVKQKAYFWHLANRARKNLGFTKQIRRSKGA